MKNALTSIHRNIQTLHRDAGLQLRLRLMSAEPQIQRGVETAKDLYVAFKLKATDYLDNLRAEVTQNSRIYAARAVAAEILLTTGLAAGFAVTDRDGPYAAGPAFDHAVDMCKRGVYASPSKFYQDFGDSHEGQVLIADVSKVVYRSAGCLAVPGTALGAGLNATQYAVRDLFNDEAPAEENPAEQKGRLDSGIIKYKDAAP